MSTGKVLNPSAVIALQEALSSVFWYKKDLKRFLTLSLHSSAVLSLINWDESKVSICDQLIGIMSWNQEKYLDDMILIATELSRMQSFPYLKNADDVYRRTENAKTAIENLNQLILPYVDWQAEKEKIEERRRQNKEMLERNLAFKSKVQDVRQQYLGFFALNPQSRGYALEKVLCELFALYDLSPKKSYKISGEQIDGAFSFNGSEFLLECKWTDGGVDKNELVIFSSKVDSKLDNTLGLFISINGFMPTAVQKYSGNGSKIILMTGADLLDVLEQRVTLDDLLREKVMHAARTGEILLESKALLAP